MRGEAWKATGAQAGSGEVSVIIWPDTRLHRLAASIQ